MAGCIVEFAKGAVTNRYISPLKCYLATGICRFVTGIDYFLQVEELAGILDIPGDSAAEFGDERGVLGVDTQGPVIVVKSRSLIDDLPFDINFDR